MAAETTANAKDYGKVVDVNVKGPGPGREITVRSYAAREINSIVDVTQFHTMVAAHQNVHAVNDIWPWSRQKYKEGKSAKFEKPISEIVLPYEETSKYAVCIAPLERGFGITLEIQLEEFYYLLPGASPYAIEVEGARHEFSAIEEVREDVTSII